MFRDRWKQVMDKFEPDAELVNRTLSRMQARQSTVGTPSFRPPLRSVMAGWLLLIPLGLGVVWLFSQLDGWMWSQPTKPAPSVVQTDAPNDPAFADGADPDALIGRHYVPFEAKEYVAAKAKAPSFPENMEALLESSRVVILGTIRDVGVYRPMAERYHPKASFGTYIYTVQVDRVLEGTPETVGTTWMLVKEIAWATPKQQVDNIVTEWQFAPYTFRPEDAKNLNPGDQYVFFLKERDDTGMFPLAVDGFGVFSVDGLEQLAGEQQLKDLEDALEQGEPGRFTPERVKLLYNWIGLQLWENVLNRGMEAADGQVMLSPQVTPSPQLTLSTQAEPSSQAMPSPQVSASLPVTSSSKDMRDIYTLILDAILTVHPGHQNGTAFIAIDMSNFTGVDADDKQRILDHFREYGVDVLEATFDQLVEKGLYDSERMALTGILLRIGELAVSDTTIVATGSVYHSAKGAHGLEVTVERKDGQWQVTMVEETWIS